MGGTVTTQTDFRYRNDDGGEPTGSPPTGASWKAAENVDWVPVVGDLDAPFRLRFQISTTGMDEAQKTYTIRLSVNDGSYLAITTTSTDGVISVPSADTSWTINDNDPTTEQMDGSGTFKAGDIDETGTTGDIQIRVNEDTEVEFVLQLDGANLSGGEKLEFRVYGGASPLDAYTVTPTIASAPTPPSGSIEQGSFRFRPTGAEEAVNDNASEDWEAIKDTDVTMDMLTIHGGLLFRLRIELKEVASTSKTLIPKIQYRINAGSWTDPRAWDYLNPGAESGTYDAVMLVNKATTTDGAATTDLFGGLTFVAGTVNHDQTANSVTLNNEHTELEFAILISHFYNTRQYLSDGDTVDFRIVESDDTLLDGTYDFPRVTINIPAGYIGGTCIETSANFSYIVIPDGTFYGPMEDAELNSNIMMMESTDEGDSWNPVDNVTALAANDMESWSMAYDDTNKIIHCLHVGGDARYLQYATKDHATEANTWLHIGADPDFWSHVLNASVDSTNQSAEIILRGSTLYALYPDLSTTDQIFYRKKPDLSSTNNWGSEVSIDVRGGGRNFSGVAAVLGPNSDLIHIFYSDLTNYDILHVSLNTSDTLGTLHTVETDIEDGPEAQHGMTNAISWYNGTTEKAMIAYIDMTNRYLYTVIVDNDGTPDTRQLASNSVQAVANQSSLNSRQPAASLGIDTNTDTAWVFYSADRTAMDMYRASNVDGAGWTGHTEEKDAVTLHGIRGQVFTEVGGDTVFGYTWETQYNQGGTPKSGYAGTSRYDKYIIAVGGGADAMPMAMNTYHQLR